MPANYSICFVVVLRFVVHFRQARDVRGDVRSAQQVAARSLPLPLSLSLLMLSPVWQCWKGGLGKGKSLF